MKYKNARAILPDALVRELQRYLEGGYLYIPVRQQRRRAWGELSGYREELRQRNEAIRAAYRQGASMEKLARRYSLSVSAMKKIIYQKK